MNKYLEKIAELKDSTIRRFMRDHAGRNYTKFHDFDNENLDEGLLRLGVYRSEIDKMNYDDRFKAGKLLDQLPDLGYSYGLGAAEEARISKALANLSGQKKYDEEFKLKKDIALQVIQKARQELGAENSVDVYRKWNK